MTKENEEAPPIRTRILIWHASIAILSGIVLILLSSVWSSHTHKTRAKLLISSVATEDPPVTSSGSPPTSQPICTLTTAAQAMLQTIGVALVGFGIFGLLIETKNWRDYFGKRIEEVVLRQSYLDTLERNSLKALQVKVLKAFFHDQTIDREGSFLNYFQTNLHRFITEPYREDVTAELELREEVDGCYRIFDRVAYTCRKTGSTIQESVNWIPDLEEFRSVESMMVRVKFPYWHQRKGETEPIYNLADDKCEPKKDLARESIHIPLDKYKDLDQLIIIVEATYLIDAQRFQCWQMANPTKNFTFIITHPPDYSLQLKPLVLDPETVEITTKLLSATVKCDAWMLPKSGLAWRFVKRGNGDGQQVPPAYPEGHADATSASAET